jgi:hypothetical protein
MGRRATGRPVTLPRAKTLFGCERLAHKHCVRVVYREEVVLFSKRHGWGWSNKEVIFVHADDLYYSTSSVASSTVFLFEETSDSLRVLQTTVVTMPAGALTLPFVNNTPHQPGPSPHQRRQRSAFLCRLHLHCRFLIRRGSSSLQA